MNRNLIWIYILLTQLYDVTSLPVQDVANAHDASQELRYNSGSGSYENIPNNDEKVISVRITSSVAIARGTQKPDEPKNKQLSIKTNAEIAEHHDQLTDLPPNLRGANIEFLKQLNAKKESNPKENGDHLQTSALRYDADEIISYETKNDQQSTNDEGIQRASKILSSDDFNRFRSQSISVLDEALKLADERSNPNITDDDKFTESKPTENAFITTLYEDSEFIGEDKDNYSHLDYNKDSKEIDDSIAESSIKSVLEIANKHNGDYENIENVPLARSLVHSPSSKNYIQGLNNKPPSERESSTRLTTVSFNIVHDAPKVPNFNDPRKPYVHQGQSFQEHHKFYDSPTIYSRPAQIYSEPAKIYSEPSKIYSEPAKIYSEPAKIYSEPAKIYSEPAKFYSEPASLHLKPSSSSNYSPWDQQPPSSISTTLSTTPTTAKTVADSGNTQPAQQQPEKNYEVDEKVSVLTDGRSHGEQETSTEKCKQESCKVGYVVKGRQFNKYRVEERTSDGFIVGEYGVVRNEDGALRGVRYTADSEASPRLIYDALMKFLQLK